MKNIQEIFENALFRIPDYQRGFAWKQAHLDDFWQDLSNLRDDRFHYTGALTLEVPNSIDLSKWKGDDWIIQTGSYKPFYIVDGQQRITTIILLLFVLIDDMDNDSQYLYQSKSDLVAKYIFKSNDRNKLQSYIFGYEVDDPSYEYLKTKIFKEESSSALHFPETIYTNNLGFAFRFFKDAVADFSQKEKEKLFKKVTQQLKFDLKILQNDLDIFVVFETMNNRGKPLTNLEKLKNRLIYLTTLMHDTNENERKEIRKHINDVWKSCYEYLGKNKENPLNDDLFLRNHFIVYHAFDKEKDFPWKNIFKDIYTVQNTVSKSPKLRYNALKSYTQNLQKAARFWYIINNPIPSLSFNFINEDECEWLVKLNRLGFRVFAPLTLSVFLIYSDSGDRIKYLKQIERFIFLNYLCASRRSNLGNSDFPYTANYLFNKKEGVTLNKVIETIHQWTYGDEEYDGYYSNEKFIETIRDLFTVSDKNGYYDWPGLKYLLHEYEEHIQGDEESKVKWNTPNSIEHIYPQDREAEGWKAFFMDFTPKQKKYLSNSLGNLILLRQAKNSSLSNKAFDFKKVHQNEDGDMVGFINGSHSEIEVSQIKIWDAKTIFKRGKKIIDFMQSRWGITFTSAEVKKLLLVDEQLIEKL